MDSGQLADVRYHRALLCLAWGIAVCAVGTAQAQEPRMLPGRSVPTRPWPVASGRGEDKTASRVASPADVPIRPVSLYRPWYQPRVYGPPLGQPAYRYPFGHRYYEYHPLYPRAPRFLTLPPHAPAPVNPGGPLFAEPAPSVPPAEAAPDTGLPDDSSLPYSAGPAFSDGMGSDCCCPSGGPWGWGASPWTSAPYATAPYAWWPSPLWPGPLWSGSWGPRGWYGFGGPGLTLGYNGFWNWGWPGRWAW